MSGSFIEPCRPDDLVRAVGRDLIELGLVRGLSLFTPEREVWDLPVAQELHRLYNENPDVSADPFLVKLERQLAPGSDEAKQLAAELLTLQGLPLMDVTARKLREDITLVLSWMREPVSVPPTVLAAFGQGSYRVGQGGHNNRWRWLADAVDLVIGWWTLSEAQQASARADPWKWQEAIYRIGGIPMLREELLYLAFPEHFLPIINVADKKAIRAAFAEPGAVPAEVNKDLFDITVRLQREAKTKRVMQSTKMHDRFSGGLIDLMPLWMSSP